MQVGVAEGDPATVGVADTVAVGVAVGVRVAVGVAVAVGVGVGVPHGPVRTLFSTVFVSPLPLNPPTTNRLLFPIAVPPVKECGTFVFGPLDQVLATVS